MVKSKVRTDMKRVVMQAEHVIRQCQTWHEDCEKHKLRRS